MLTQFLRGTLAAGTLLLFSQPLLATHITVSNLLTIEQEGVGTMTLSSADLGCADTGPNSIGCDGSGQTIIPANPAFTWMLSNWGVTLDTDPLISQAFGFTNTGGTATFTITVSGPVAPVLPSSLLGGSTGGSVTDADFSGTGGLTTSAPDSYFVGLIDGSPVPITELHSDPFSLGFAFAGQNVNIPAVSFGLPGPTTPGPAVTTSIGIRNRFTLSGGDSMSTTNFFIVEPVPEPSALALSGLAVLGLLLFGRRRVAG